MPIPFEKSKAITLCLMAVIFLGSCQPADSLTPSMRIRPTQKDETKDWLMLQPGHSWQIQYVGEIDLDVQADVFSLDLFETSEEDIQVLHARGVMVLCYLNAGSWENWRPDRGDFPEIILGNDYEGWPGERWLDISQINHIAPVMTARLDLCAQKGFDGVDVDNLDGYTNDTGFELTADNQLAYNRWLAEEAHQRGLAIGLKNDPEQVHDLVASFDWIITESCFYEGWCELVTPFLEADKPVFAVEYTDNGMRLEDFCDQAADLSIDALLKHRDLNAWREACP